MSLWLSKQLIALAVCKSASIWTCWDCSARVEWKQSSSAAIICDGEQLCSCKQGAKAALKFARSPVHAWGMFAKEVIEDGALVCEYVGEEIRKAVRLAIMSSAVSADLAAVVLLYCAHADPFPAHCGDVRCMVMSTWRFALG